MPNGLTPSGMPERDAPGWDSNPSLNCLIIKRLWTMASNPPPLKYLRMTSSKPEEPTSLKRRYSTRVDGHWFILMKHLLIKTTVAQIPHGIVVIGKIIPDLTDHLALISTNLLAKENVLLS